MSRSISSVMVATPDTRALPGAADNSLADVSRARFALALILILVVASAVRFTFPVADPPVRPSVGVVWDDEGGWVHNARNRALFGAWQIDKWNPMYIAPVLTGLEYGSFALFGVGLSQARLVSEILGVVSVLLLGLGVARLGNRLSGLIAAALLATHFVYVMYNRAATLEATMVAFLVLSWYGYARAGASPRWGLLAGCGAITAYFSKASAVFFVVALAADALLSIVLARRVGHHGSAEVSGGQLASLPADAVSHPARRAAGMYTLAGLCAAAVLAVVVFVVPHWHDYRFYNWQMSVTRKPTYTMAAIIGRASWLPVASDFFTGMWAVLVIASVAALGRLRGIWKMAPAERILLWWVALGLAEVIVHDVQERYFVILVPPLVALAAIALGRDRRLVPAELPSVSKWWLLTATPLVLYALYVVAAAITRLPFLAYTVALSPAVRTGAVLALVGGIAFYMMSARVLARLARERWTPAAAVLVAALIMASDAAQFAQWASTRTYKNYEAMVLLGKWLPAGTLVHGKLANGLSLENRIRPVFVGRGFGNYEDRRTRDDIHYIVTYISPSIGYEGSHDASGRSIIQDVLDTYPERQVMHVFDVSGSGGDDAAVLFDKRPARR